MRPSATRSSGWGSAGSGRRPGSPARTRNTPSKKLARPPDRLGGPPPRLGGGLCRRGLVEPPGPAGPARLGRDAAAARQSAGEGRCPAQGSGLLRAVAHRSGSGAAGLCPAGRPVSRVTPAFLAWGAARLGAEGKRVWVLVWDNAAWHVSRAVRAWMGAHNRTVKLAITHIFPCSINGLLASLKGVSFCAEPFEGAPFRVILSGSNIDRGRNYNCPCGW